MSQQELMQKERKLPTGCFRLLVDGEVVLSSDEFIDDDCVRWLPAERWTIGRPWHNGLKPMRREISATGTVPSVDAAYAMGAKGGPVVEAERLAFESWMRGHCWALSAEWDGKTYRSPAENVHYFCPHAMRTRELWAAWRDRAALAAGCVQQGEGIMIPNGDG